MDGVADVLACAFCAQVHGKEHVYALVLGSRCSANNLPGLLPIKTSSVLQVASPFAQFVKDLPPITPPRVQWDAGCNWPGQPGLSPALASFATPQLSTE